MAVLSSATNARSNTRSPFGNLARTNQSDNDGANKPKAKVWLNFGYEANGRFVSLPMGIPVDTMKPADARGQDEDWVKFRTAQNHMLDSFIRMGADMEPGEERVVLEQSINGLMFSVRLRRANEELDIPQQSNEYAVDLTSMFAPSLQAAE